MRPNIVLIISDTLRLDYLGCYGNDSIRTPRMDAFAEESVLFTWAFPESLPTIPVRRAIHTGRRAYPFRNYRPVKWDIVDILGWEPMDNDEDTLAENLAEAGYQTGLVTDTLPYFAPGFNFTRGFHQWEFVRGQQQDRWRSPYSVPEERLARYGDPQALMKNPHGIVPMHLANTAHVKHESDTTTARTFQWAMEFLDDNRSGQPFYLMIDCFDPHEPWEAPPEYYEMYGNPGYNGRRILYVSYGPVDAFGYTAEEVEYVRAQYSGLVSLVDTWMGRFIDRLHALDLADTTAVFLTSDHGTNFCENPRSIIGKPEDAMYPPVMRLPLLARMPGGAWGGEICDELVYDVDLTATIYDIADVIPVQTIDGRSLLPLMTGEGSWKPRSYVTCRYNNHLCYVDKQNWILANIDREMGEVFDLGSDPTCTKDLGEAADRGLFSRAWRRLLEDAGGRFPDYRERKQTDAIGRSIE